MRRNDDIMLEKGRFSFTGYLHCPCCGAGMLVIDNKSVSCPECEAKREQGIPNVGGHTLKLSQEIF